MLLVSEYISAMRHALGKVPSAGHSLYHSFNFAGSRLYSAHTWDWLNRGPVSVASVAGQDYLDLPDDFGGMLTCTVPNTGTFIEVRVVDLATMADLRANTTVTINSGVMYICFEGMGGGASQVPTNRALLYPTPSTNGAPTFSMTYTKAWKVLTASDNDKPAPIPFEFEDALLTGACLLARKRENPEMVIDSSEYLFLIEQLKSNDAQLQPSGGHIRNGVAARMNRGPNASIKVGIASL